MKNEQKERSLSTLAALLMLAVFAVGVVSVLLGGAGVYNRLVQRDRIGYDNRTCVQYVATKIRQAPEGIVVEPFGQSDALVIPQHYGQDLYLTRIYCHDGWLMELFSSAAGGFAPEDGEKILPLADLQLKQDDALVTAMLTGEDERVWELTLAVRRGDVVLP